MLLPLFSSLWYNAPAAVLHLGTWIPCRDPLHGLTLPRGAQSASSQTPLPAQKDLALGLAAVRMTAEPPESQCCPSPVPWTCRLLVSRVALG